MIAINRNAKPPEEKGKRVFIIRTGETHDPQQLLDSLDANVESLGKKARIAGMMENVSLTIAAIAGISTACYFSANKNDQAVNALAVTIAHCVISLLSGGYAKAMQSIRTADEDLRNKIQRMLDDAQ